MTLKAQADLQRQLVDRNERINELEKELMQKTDYSTKNSVFSTPKCNNSEELQREEEEHYKSGKS
jgi:hypothetical protein